MKELYDLCYFSLKEASPNTWVELIQKYKKQKRFFLDMPISSDIYIFYIDTRKIKETILPMPDKCINYLNELIVVTISDIITELLKVTVSLFERICHTGMTKLKKTHKM